MIKIILLSLFLAPLLVIDPPVLVFIITVLSPAFIALVTDRRKDKSTGMTVAFFNLAGLSIYLVPMFGRLGNNKFDQTLTSTNFLIVLLFAAMGYFVVWLVPRIFVIYADYKNQARARVVSEKMTKLIEKWGVEVRH